MRTVLAWCFLLLMGVLLGGCASDEIMRGELRYGMTASPEGKQILFPPPPDQPRYSYGGELIGERNFFFDRPEKGFGRQLLEWLTGIGDSSNERELLRPYAVTTDSAGRIFVSDVALPGVFVFDPVEGRPQVLTRATVDSGFKSPSGVALGPDGRLLVADAEAGFVAQVDLQGNVFDPIGVATLKRPTGVIYDPSQKRIIVADASEHNLKFFDLDGRLLSVVGGLGDKLGEFNRPTHLAIWRNELYVTDTFNARIQVLDLDSGSSLRSIGKRGGHIGQLSMPKGVGVDSDGNVYVIESLFDHLLVFDRQGRFLLPIGGTGYASGNFYLPAGVWVDRGDRVYVADMFNGRVVTYMFLGSEAESEE